MTKQQIIDYFIESNAEHNETFRNYENMNLAWKQHIEDLYMSDAIKQLQRDSLEESFSKKDFEKINQQIKEKIEASKIHENIEEQNDVTIEYGQKKFDNKEFEKENVDSKDLKFRYMLLNRMQSDCEYYLDYGNRNPGALWAKNEENHIKNMISLYNSFPDDDKPMWLSPEQLNDYSLRLTGKSVKDFGIDLISSSEITTAIDSKVRELCKNDEDARLLNNFDSIYKQLNEDDSDEAKNIKKRGVILFKKLSQKNRVVHAFISHIKEKGQLSLSDDSESYDSKATALVLALKEIGLLGKLGFNDEIPSYNKRNAGNRALDISSEGKKIVPFEIINNESTGQINIKFNFALQNPLLTDIIKELKENGWNYASSSRQWYPIKIENSVAFANELQKKYELLLNKTGQMQLPFNKSVNINTNNTYDRIKFFDRNYEEAKDFRTFYSENKQTILLEEAKTILKALNHKDVGFVSQRTDRLGIDEKNNLVIVTKIKSDLKEQKTNPDELLVIAKAMAEQSVTNANKMLEDYNRQNYFADDKKLQDIFKKLYESNVEKSIQINNDMNTIFEKYHKDVSTEQKKIASLNIGDTVGLDTVKDVFEISKGVYQAVLAQGDGALLATTSLFVLDKNIANELSPLTKDLLENRGNHFVIENKYNEPYIIRELIAKKLMPPRDNEYIEHLDEYIVNHPVKYAKLYPVNTYNFENRLKELSEIDKDFNKTFFELGRQLISMVDDYEKPKLNKWLISKGCTSKANMEKIFASWLSGKSLSKENIKQKDSGYPPRGEKS